MNEATQEEDQEFEQPQERIDPNQEKERGLGPALGMQIYCVNLSIKNLPTMKKWQKGKNGRMI